MENILIKDLCRRLPYGVLIRMEDNSIKRLVLKKEKDFDVELLNLTNNCKPILYSINNSLMAGDRIQISKNKSVVPIIELARKLHPDSDTHEVIKNTFVISKNYVTSTMKYPVSYQTHLSDLTHSIEGIETCLECHVDYLGLIELGLAEKINKYVESQYKNFYK